MAKMPGLTQPDDIARVGFFDRLALLREEPVRAGVTRDPLAEPRVADGHVLLEAPGADAQEGHAVAVLRVHVRLDLEDEAGEGLGSSARVDAGRSSVARPGGGASSMQRLEERLDAEVVERAAEEDRRDVAARGTPRGRTASPAPASSSTLLAQVLRGRRSPMSVGERRVVEAADLHRRAVGGRPRCARSVRTSLRARGRTRPGRSARRRSASSSGRRAMLEHALDLVEQLQRLAAGVVELVDEGEDRDAPRCGRPRTACASAARCPWRCRAP